MAAQGSEAVLLLSRPGFAEFKRLDDVGDWKWFLLNRLLREPGRVPPSANGQALLCLTAISGHARLLQMKRGGGMTHPSATRRSVFATAMALGVAANAWPWRPAHALRLADSGPAPKFAGISAWFGSL